MSSPDNRADYPESGLPQFNRFWLLTIYDFGSFLVPDMLDRYAPGNLSKLIFAPDCSLSLYLQKDDPDKDIEVNRLPPAVEKKQ